jgi:hypothetical protein
VSIFISQLVVVVGRWPRISCRLTANSTASAHSVTISSAGTWARPISGISSPVYPDSDRNRPPTIAMAQVPIEVQVPDMPEGTDASGKAVLSTTKTQVFRCDWPKTVLRWQAALSIRPVAP